MKLIEIAHRTIRRDAPRTASGRRSAFRHPTPRRGERFAQECNQGRKCLRGHVWFPSCRCGGANRFTHGPCGFLRGLNLPDSFAGYCIIGPAAAGSNSDVLICRILFKAIGSHTAASIKRAAAQHHSPVIAFYDDWVEVQEQFVARIDEFVPTRCRSPQQETVA